MSEVIETSCGICGKPLCFVIIKNHNLKEWEKFKANLQADNRNVIGISYGKYLERKALKRCECDKHKVDSDHYKLAE